MRQRFASIRGELGDSTALPTEDQRHKHRSKGRRKSVVHYITRRPRSTVGRSRRNLCATSKNAYRYIRIHDATRYASHFVPINLPSRAVSKFAAAARIIQRGASIGRKTCLRALPHMEFLCSPEISFVNLGFSLTGSRANSNTREPG